MAYIIFDNIPDELTIMDIVFYRDNLISQKDVYNCIVYIDKNNSNDLIIEDNYIYCTISNTEFSFSYNSFRELENSLKNGEFEKQLMIKMIEQI
jgi:hypothetical protein